MTESSSEQVNTSFFSSLLKQARSRSNTTTSAQSELFTPDIGSSRTRPQNQGQKQDEDDKDEEDEEEEEGVEVEDLLWSAQVGFHSFNSVSLDRRTCALDRHSLAQLGATR